MDKAKEAIVQKLKASGCKDHQAETDASGYYTGRKLFLLQRNLLPQHLGSIQASEQQPYTG